MYNEPDFAMGFARIKPATKAALADIAIRESSPSNRCNNCSTKVFPAPTLLANNRAGVDRIKIGIPFDSKVSDWKAFLSHLKKAPIGKHGRAVKVKDAKTGTRLEFFVWPTANTSVIYVELNPARYRDPSGYSLLHPNEVKNVVADIISTYFTNGLIIPTFMILPSGTLATEEWDPDWKSEISLSRLDVSADFLITDSSFSIDHLSEVESKWSHGTAIFHNHGIANTWTNSLKSQDGRLKFYNKYEQSKKVKLNPMAPKGTFRFEYRMQSRHLHRNHLHTLTDLSEDRFEAALRHGWDLSRLSLPFTTSTSWKQIIRDSVLTYQEKAELIGFLEEDEVGNDTYFPDSYRKLMRNKAKSVGISFKKSLKGQTKTSVKLDLETGMISITPPPLSVNT